MTDTLTPEQVTDDVVVTPAGAAPAVPAAPALPVELPPAPAPAPRRQVLVGTTAFILAATTLVCGMLALWLKLRDRGLDATVPRWLPDKITIPEVPSNVMLIAFLPACVFAQWAVYAYKRQARNHAVLALGLTALIGLAIINAQAFIYSEMGLPAKGSTAYNAMFYAVTGVFMVLVIAGVVYSLVTLFRVLGGRQHDGELVAGQALYWYFLAAAFCAVWLVVYVTK